ncbi:T9SS type A sorting domain-containing protein [Wenyingzhuangia aestuarii]|uniref:T9SS type A sorting domain-containing protein n=1 Tax=Wenyingzhuangia aestuarii TaxID=1647582 RepID=UPI00143C7EDD|nr:T9SS type A sorting domain-containing protein [Wenyingzhuangia aestuarii]NJB84201.1 hypothetical protein [Wenyingzhuangia aestuarii]
MKTKLLLSLTLTFTLTFFGQTLEHSYSTQGAVYGNTLIFITDNGFNYYTINDNNEISLYNSNHTLNKTVSITLPNSETIRTIFLPSDKLFNSDSMIEFVIVTNDFNMFLFNENGTNLFSFGQREEIHYFKDSNNNFKLITTDGGKKNNTQNYDVYSVSGTLSNSQQSLFKEREIFSFPNPATSEIKITNPVKNKTAETLNVFDLAGRKIIEKKVNQTDGEYIILDISKLNKGTYVYSINGKNNKFIKN